MQRCDEQARVMQQRDQANLTFPTPTQLTQSICFIRPTPTSNLQLTPADSTWSNPTRHNTTPPDPTPPDLTQPDPTQPNPTQCNPNSSFI
mmetsp:Transcript_11789/g.19172  ORF Transcript_11789/g.19172 Transcript_11789/m.19172 type:complete len:90 (-) Transcript_11789:261-530(-)